MSRTARLGAFMLASLAILALGIFIIGDKKYLFTSTYSLRAKFTNVAGLSTGADVRVGGVHTGTVTALELPHKAGDQITILMQLNSSTHEIIKRDSTASIETEGLLGNQYVALSFGSAGQADVQDGEIIQSLPPLEMSALMGKANGLLDVSHVALDNIAQTTANLNSISTKMDHGSGTVGALVNDRKLYNNLEQTSSLAKDTIAAAETGMIDFQEDMEALKHNFLLRGYFKKRGYESSADLAKNEIENLPASATLREFTFEARKLFDKQDSNKLKKTDALKVVGESLAESDFGLAVIAVSTGMTGDTDKSLVLAQARTKAIRDYLVDHYAFDDTSLKTVAIGKQADGASDPGKSDDSKPDESWGLIRILIYPPGTPVPPAKTSKKTEVSAAPGDMKAKDKHPEIAGSSER